MNSPWLEQWKDLRESKSVEADMGTDVLIVGGGIAGIMTAYFVLNKTSKKVILVEANKVAHGATGHNAGQIVSYFESGFKNLANTHGLDLATRAYQDVLSAWDLLEEIQAQTSLQTPIHIFAGYTGIRTQEDLLEILENRFLLKEMGIQTESVLISSEYKTKIPEKYKDVYASVPPGNLMDLLQTENTDYFAASVAKAGVTNSARLTEELASILLEHYASRFEIFEHSPVRHVDLQEGKATALLRNGKNIEAKRVILCTNGFEHIEISNQAGGDVDTQFHENIYGVVGYMSAYLEESKSAPIAISYHDTHAIKTRSDTEIAPYFYLTRRPYEHGKHNLVCLGGPEQRIEDKKHYEADLHDFPAAALEDLTRGIHANYAPVPRGILKFKYEWHGLMGYTKNGLRCIGPEPLNPVLLYNIGCNGVGILPSVFGGKRIADFLKHGRLEVSLFDPTTALDL